MGGLGGTRKRVFVNSVYSVSRKPTLNPISRLATGSRASWISAPKISAPFALINYTENNVRVVLDAEMMACEALNYHPLTNTASTTITPDGLMTFLRSCGHQPSVVEL